VGRDRALLEALQADLAQTKAELERARDRARAQEAVPGALGHLLAAVITQAQASTAVPAPAPAPAPAAPPQVPALSAAAAAAAAAGGEGPSLNG